MSRLKHIPAAKLEAESALLREENYRLTNILNSMHGEIYGARLAAKYLDKELAGRLAVEVESMP
jgi:golgi-associated PDZ and coiled-coil motif-containing protein